MRGRAAQFSAQVIAAGAQLRVRGDAEYPGALLDLEHPPLWLVTRGDERHLESIGVAIVGTRDTTPYGTRIAREIAHAVARAGGVVVSGLARGVDAVAHRAALEAGGATIAVLGTGVDVAYPTGHRALLDEVARYGLVVSEQPVGARAAPGAFPARNRIIAALARVTIVVEAGRGSGALITADEATAIGREVMAVPGPVDSPQSLGCNRLVREGAYIVTEVADVLHAAGLSVPARGASGASLEGPARAVWEALAKGPLDADALAIVSRLPARTCLATVTELELKGLVECGFLGDIRRRE
ncbi:MAG: DNA-protecting protein DprA [Gemmatimonadetes bacterium]|nr:DNA-protecting protein DprA [Gemmatimonadota bacterium]